MEWYYLSALSALSVEDRMNRGSRREDRLGLPDTCHIQFSEWWDPPERMKIRHNCVEVPWNAACCTTEGKVMTVLWEDAKAI